MLRLVLPIALLAACEPRYEDDIYIPPDGQVGGCVGTFDLLSPKDGLHYSPHVDVHMDSAELDANIQLELTMVDDTGATYQWSDFHHEPPQRNDNPLFVGDVFHYELAPSRRYTLTVAYCNDQQVETATFFTSAE